MFLYTSKASKSYLLLKAVPQKKYMEQAFCTSVNSMLIRRFPVILKNTVHRKKMGFTLQSSPAGYV